MDILSAVENEQNYTLTENLAVTHATTKSALLDFFALGGALRSREEKEIIYLFQRAFSENRLLALKCLFYFRDIRGGQGERKTFRIIINWLDKNYPEISKKNISNIPFFGRFDDLYSINNPWEYIKEQLEADKKSDRPSLLAKWLKSENTSSKESIRLARITREKLGLNSREYRKLLSGLRKKIDIVERKMSYNKWNGIDYEKVPSRASMIYAKAFRKHDEDRYNKYIEDVKSGDKEIKTGTLYPYDIVNKILTENGDDTYNVMWDNLPNYIEGVENSIVVADTSGSMRGIPISVSVSLAIYFAERIKGKFADHFITFSSRPKLQKIVGKNITEKVRYLYNAEWEMNTDLQAVFNLILSAAIKNSIPQSEMINKIYIISDMEFDCCHPQKTNFEVIKEKYRAAGYEMPMLIFWNVNSKNNQSPVTIDDQGVYLVSGCSPVIFKNLMKNKSVSAYDLMLEVLNGERYNRVVE